MGDSFDKEKYFSIKVSDDLMKVFLTVKPFTQKGTDVTVNDVVQALQSKGISGGIVKEDGIKTVIDKVANTNISEENVLIAEGIQAVNGEDGRLEFLFNVDKKVNLQEDAHGKVDFHDMGMIKGVEKDQPLVTLIAPTQGEAGKNVYGTVIHAKGGKPCALPIGENTRVSDKDGKVMVATLSGVVSYSGGVVSVQSCCTVEKDVDFSVGNISSKGAVIVKGNVKSGFVIDAAGDVEVWGTVEDSTIKAKGNVLLKCGFLGSGKGRIEADGDVTIGFARNQTIVANNVDILREAVDCTIYAKNAVKVHGDKISIEGGITAAGALIEVESLGSRNEVHTDVEAGINYAAHQNLMNKRKEVSGLKAALKTIDKELKSIYAMKEVKGEIPPQYVNIFERLVPRKNEVEKKLKILESDGILPVNKDAKVVVNKVVHPGVEIKIGELAMDILEEYRGATFFLSEDEIRVKKHNA
jgi:uncharacterized protein (DUF342 family)